MESCEPAGVQLLTKLPLAQCPQFLHHIIDGICGRARPRFQDYGSVWNLREWLEVMEETEAFIKAAVAKDEHEEKAGQQLNGLNPEYQDAVVKCVKSRQPEIKEALLQRVCAMSSSYLQDFDWQLKGIRNSEMDGLTLDRKAGTARQKLAMSSDKLSTLQLPLVNLDLDIVKNGAIEPVSIEMNKKELQNLINSLEAANKVVLQLK